MLEIERHGVEGEAHWFDLYYCEHITNKEYPIDLTLPVGGHSNMVLCKHCSEHVRGLVAQEIINKSIRGLTPAEKGQALAQMFAPVNEPGEPMVESYMNRVRLGRRSTDPFVQPQPEGPKTGLESGL